MPVIAILTVGGTTYTASQRGANRMRIDRFRWSFGGPRELDFTLYAQGPTDSVTNGTAVSLSLDGAGVFTGDIVTLDRKYNNSTGWTLGCRCLGLEYRAQNIPFTAIDGTGLQTYNMATDDPYYSPSLAGKSVGQILTASLTNHAAALSAIGITSYTAGDFAGGDMDIVPDSRVDLGGERFWNALLSVTQRWARNYALYIEPTGNVRALYTRTTSYSGTYSGFKLTARTLTMGSDPIMPPALTRDTTDTWGAVVIRGGADVQSVILSLSSGTLTEGFTSADKSAWNWSKYKQPGNSSDWGTCSVTSSTTIRVTSQDSTLTWSTNQLGSGTGGLNAWLYVYNSAAGGTVAAHEMYPITSNTALSAGGTSVITIANALQNTGYTRYEIIGQNTPSANTWRVYTIADAYIAAHLVARFSKATPFATADSLSLTYYPTAAIYWSSTGNPPYNSIFAPFDLLIGQGQLRFVVPVVKAWGTQSVLDTGGFTTRTSTNGVPADIKVMVPYSRGALTLRTPTTGYTGTANTVDGLTKTKYVDLQSWKWLGDGSTQVQPLANMYLDSVKDTIVEGSLTYMGYASDFLAPGYAVNIAGTMATSYSTGWMSSMVAPVQGAEFSWGPENPTEIVTTLQLSTRRQPATGDSLYTHPAFGGIAVLEGQLQGGSSITPFTLPMAGGSGGSAPLPRGE